MGFLRINLHTLSFSQLFYFYLVSLIFFKNKKLFYHLYSRNFLLIKITQLNSCFTLLYLSVKMIFLLINIKKCIVRKKNKLKILGCFKMAQIHCITKLSQKISMFYSRFENESFSKVGIPQVVDFKKSFSNQASPREKKILLK